MESNMLGGIQDNIYANSVYIGRQRSENRAKTKEPPAAKNPQGRVIITLVVLLILMFLMLVVFASLLFVFYNSIGEQQSHLKNNVKELASRLEYNEQETKENFTEEVSRLKDSVKELASQLEKHKEETDSGLKKNVSYLQGSVANIVEDLKKMEMKEKRKEASCTSCSNGWQLIRSNCYSFQDNEDTWEKSREGCAKLNATILILKDKAELDSLLPVIGKRRFWIGLRRDSANINHWLWADGSPLTFSAWNKGEPNNIHGIEHCAEILGGPQAMNDGTCDNKIAYICKRQWTC